MKYEDVVVEENSHKVYLCKLTDGTELKLQVNYNCESATIDMTMYEYKSSDDKQYRENEVAEILHEVEIEDDECSYHWDSLDKMDFKSIEKYLIQEDVYRYTNQDELTDILVALNEPFIDGADKKMVLPKNFGIVFYWSEYDDFSCYGDGFIHRVKIIEGVK